MLKLRERLHTPEACYCKLCAFYAGWGTISAGCYLAGGGMKGTGVRSRNYSLVACGVGSITLDLARPVAPGQVVGIAIDPQLVE